jgi:hypothetical protein
MRHSVLEPTLEAYDAMEERQVRTKRTGPIIIPSPIPAPIPIPLLQGSRFLIWKQDPSVGELGLRVRYLPTYTLNGPKDSRVTAELAGTTPVTKNAQGDFIFPVGSPELDCSHTFAIVRDTLTMYQRVRGGAAIPWAWNTGGNTDPLAAYPRAGVTANAYYSRAQRALKFFYFTPTGASTPTYTCRSLDIVAHETGHAILDGLKPGWLAGGNPPQTGGLHEAFGDLTAIFLALSQLDQVEAAIALTKANLHDKNFLAALAEQFGSALGLPQGLRNADNDLKLSQVTNEVHAISQVFTGGIYDFLADVFAFEKNKQAAVKDPARVLLEVGAHVAKLLIKAIEAAPATGATYADVVNQMLVASKNLNDPPVYRTYLRNRFTYREVVVSPTPLLALTQGKMSYEDPNFTEGGDLLKLEAFHHDSDHAPQNRSTCCGTMQLHEFIMADAKHLVTGKAFTEEDILASEKSELAKSFR